MKKNFLKNFSGDMAEPAVEMYGNKRIIISDCKSVEDYTGEYIVLELNEYYLRVAGVNLVLDSYLFGQADISGEIVGVEFTTASNGKKAGEKM